MGVMRHMRGGQERRRRARDTCRAPPPSRERWRSPVAGQVSRGRSAQHGLGTSSTRRRAVVPAHDVRREPCPTSPTTETRWRQEPEIAQGASVAACIYEENKAASVRGGPKVVPHWNAKVRCLVTPVYLWPVQQSSPAGANSTSSRKLMRVAKWTSPVGGRAQTSDRRSRDDSTGPQDQSR